MQQRASLLGMLGKLPPERTTLCALVCKNLDAAAHSAATSPLNLRPSPTEGQRSVGNYKKGHVRFAGLDVAIENPAGSYRRPEWPPMQAHYGYIKGTEGKDGDHVDCFMRPATPIDWRGDAYVINQLDASGVFDEHKVMLGYDDQRSAEKAYLAHYPRGWRLGPVAVMSLSRLREWLAGDTLEPVLKGDLPGHEFRGNQHTGGIDATQWEDYGDSPPTDGERGVAIVANDVAKELGFPPEHIHFSSVVKTFDVGGTTYTQAGLAYLETGQVWIFNKAVEGVAEAERITAHEIGHIQYETVTKSLNAERTAVINDPTSYGNMRGDGTLKEGSVTASKYPVYNSLAAVVERPDAYNQLRKDDGVTQYSRSWWKAYEEGTATIHQAMHETYAEINALAYAHKAGRAGTLASQGVKSSWSKLYRAYQKESKRLSRGR